MGFVLAITAALAHAQMDSARDARETISHYCSGCHNERARVAGLVLNLTDIGGDAAVWEKAVRKLRMRTMPPVGVPRPDEATYNRLTTWLESRLDQAAAAHPNPGAPLLHRLNRTEYGNAIEDLLGLKVDVTELLPPDDSAFGFDNNADLLGLSPVLLERYLAAADRVSALALGDPDTAPAAQTYRARQDLSQDQHIEGLPFGTVGGMLVEHTFPLDADYEFRLSMFRNNLEIMRGIERPHQVELSIDGERIFLRGIGGPDDLAKMRNPTNGSDAIDARFRIRVPLKAGRHTVVATFMQERGVGTLRLQPFVRSSVDTFEAAGRPHLDTITILGPYDPRHDGAKPVKDLPSLETLARRAYRRPITEADLVPLREFYERGKSANGPRGGMQMALRRILASPSFLFRAETSPDSVAPGAVHPIDGVEMASRLSFFLWSSIPDDALAECRHARRPGETGRAGSHGEAHAGRSARRAIRVQLRGPVAAIAQPEKRAAELGVSSRISMTTCARVFARKPRCCLPACSPKTAASSTCCAPITRSSTSAWRSTTASPGVYGSNFRRVPVVQEERKGILGHGSILTVTSHADRTSPVVRGKWILENLLGAPPPAPPPEVPPAD